MAATRHSSCEGRFASTKTRQGDGAPEKSPGYKGSLERAQQPVVFPPRRSSNKNTRLCPTQTVKAENKKIAHLTQSLRWDDPDNTCMDGTRLPDTGCMLPTHGSLAMSKYRLHQRPLVHAVAIDNDHASPESTTIPTGRPHCQRWRVSKNARHRALTTCQRGRRCTWLDKLQERGN